MGQPGTAAHLPICPTQWLNTQLRSPPSFHSIYDPSSNTSEDAGKRKWQNSQLLPVGVSLLWRGVEASLLQKTGAAGLRLFTGFTCNSVQLPSEVAVMSAKKCNAPS